MRRALFAGLCDSVTTSLPSDEFRILERGFIREIELVMERHAEGNEVLVAQPYYLRSTRQFGFLLDFHFRLTPGVQFNRRVQQLCLGLDKNFRRNLDYCVDRAEKIRRFTDARWSAFASIRLNGTGLCLDVRKGFVALPASRLDGKTYLFNGKKESRGQFTGLREHVPLAPVPGPLRLLFAFRAEDRQAARRLAASLKGAKEKFGFPGFEALFKVPIEIDNHPVILPDLSEASMKAAVDRAASDRAVHQNIVPVVGLPATDDNG